MPHLPKLGLHAAPVSVILGATSHAAGGTPGAQTAPAASSPCVSSGVGTRDLSFILPGGFTVQGHLSLPRGMKGPLSTVAATGACLSQRLTD